MTPVLGQLARYGITGVSTNLLLYLAYIGLTRAGISHLWAMTMAYLTGIFVGFALNRSWTFMHRDAAFPAALRYLLSHLLGYCLNFIGLFVLVNTLEKPHASSQALMIILVAMCLFLIQRNWVFTNQTVSKPTP